MRGMEEKQLLYTAEIDEKEWEKTPPTVKRAVARLAKELAEVKKELAEVKKESEEVKKELAETELEKQGLLEKVNCSPQNSHSPPSSQLNKPKKKSQEPKSGKKRGGQPGHEGHSRYLYPVEACGTVNDYYPSHCTRCGEALTGSDPNPYRHQVVDIPPIQPKIEEHRLHQLECPHCGCLTRAELPPGVEKSGYQARTVGIVSILSGVYHLSHQAVKNVMWDLCGVEIGTGSINRLRKEASQAVSPTVESAQNYVQAQPIVGADETGFKQGNADGQNGKNLKAWLWVAVTPLVSFFCVLLSRSAEAAKQLLGHSFAGYLNCDRYGAYNWLPLAQKQFCWAHLKREFTKMAERSGVSQRLGQALLEQEKKLFALWYRVRDGTKDRAAFQREVEPIRAAVKDLLQKGADYQIGAKEKTPLAKTVRTCRQLLKAESALWLFLTVEGLEPTNNDTERAIRPAVLWRRVSFGSQSQAGSVFVARMLTVVTSLRSQGRNVLEFMTATVQAARQGTEPPSLLPEPSSPTESVTLVA